MPKPNRLTWNMKEGDTFSFDDGRIKVTLQQRSGRMARVSFDLAPDVKVDRRPRDVQEDVTPAQATG